MKRILLAAVQWYKRWVSPALPVSCRYVPTCSDYAAEALERHGAMKGSYLALRRLLRCHPFGGHGVDQVPQQFPVHGSQFTEKRQTRTIS